MSLIDFSAPTRIGLEKLVRLELEALGFQNIHAQNGRVDFQGTLADIPRANLWLRCADRVRVRLGDFTATTFDELFEQTRALPWHQFLPPDARITVSGKSANSTLGSVRACQAVTHKAIVECLLAGHGLRSLDEDGDEYRIRVTLRNDTARLTLDTTGPGLSKRGYRSDSGKAPLKETLAAALVKLSFWEPDRLLIDPMCGSGTILIEAAMIARNMAPGLWRTFAAESWPIIPAGAWEQARRDARDARIAAPTLEIVGYDIENAYVKLARTNAELARVGRNIRFGVKDVKELWIDRQYGIVITNPPYGVRVSEFRAINQIYIALNKMFRKKSGWSIYILTADQKFPDYFKRAQPDRVRKLFNGNIEARYYQYHGARPPKES